jgi:hypothetical protein
VTKDEFETQVLEMWMKTAIPMTRANVQYRTGESSRKVKKWLEELTLDGVLSLDSDAEGELLWTVPGARRPSDGPRSFAELEKLEQLRAEVGAQLAVEKEREARLREEALQRKQEQLALVKASKQHDLALEEKDDEEEEGSGLLARLRGRLSARDALEVAGEVKREIDQPRDKKKKSLLWSGGLSFFLGPLGWLYAGSFREAIPGALVWLAAASVLSRLPLFLVWPVLMVVMPLSGIAGFVYAWHYNREGKRGRILGDDKKKKKRKKLKS